MINFPDSPTLNQVFQGPNGISYTWNGTLWLVQNTFAGGTGDFMATTASGASIIAASPVTLIFANVMTGNSGGWYNVSNGRYTPPAGRYQISAGMAYSAAAASGIWLLPQKNGANIALGGQSMQAGSTSSSASLQDSANISFVVDANGTDYFTIQCQAQGATLPSVIAWSYFTAFPLTGMQGPPGPPPLGSLSLDNEVVLASPANSMTVTVPPTAKAIEIWFATLNTGNVNDTVGLILNDVQSGTPNTGLNHNGQNTYSVSTTVGGVATAGANGWALGGTTISSVGVLRVQLGFPHFVDITADYFTVNAANVMTKQQASFLGGIAGTTGFRLQNGSGTNMIVGSYMRVFAVY